MKLFPPNWLNTGMTGTLASKKCKPCEGGVEPLDAGAATRMSGELHADWILDVERAQISRTFEFPSYARTIAFANAVVWVATNEGHHPQMTIKYGSCRVDYRTTAIDGLSENDFICAAKIDVLSADS